MHDTPTPSIIITGIFASFLINLKAEGKKIIEYLYTSYKNMVGYGFLNSSAMVNIYFLAVSLKAPFHSLLHDASANRVHYQVSEMVALVCLLY